MLKTKSKFKLLLALGIMLLAVLVFNMNTVNAVTEEETQAMLNVIPDEITLDITELEFEKADDKVKEKVEAILKNENLLNKEIEVIVYEPCLYFLDTNIHTITISIGTKTKEISVSYSNSNQRNSTDEQYVKNLMNKVKSPKYYEVDLNLLNDSSKSMFDVIATYYTKQINDSSIVVKVDSGAGGTDGGLNAWTWESGTCIGIFKNGILYDVRIMGKELTVPVITVPNTVTDNELNNYLKSVITKAYKEFGEQITKIEQGTKSVAGVEIPNGYTIYSDYGMESVVIVRKEKVTEPVKIEETTTKIKLEADTTVIPANTVLSTKEVKEEKILNTVKESLKDTSIKYMVYDINLLSNGVKIQPNGKVKISITIPTDYDKTKLAVYRVSDNGDKTEYTVTVNGDVATFETDHFSTYVLAEKEIKQNTNNKTDKKKDDTPKTGTIDVVGYLSIVTVISALGIIAFRKRK